MQQQSVQQSFEQSLVHGCQQPQSYQQRPLAYIPGRLYTVSYTHSPSKVQVSFWKGHS